MSALDIPGFPALQCVISSLRDTAHFTDEEGELTNQLRDLRDWLCERAAVQAAQPEAVGWKEAAIAWTVCASIHEKWAKGKDAVFKTRQADFQRHADNARAMLASAPTEPMSAPTAEPCRICFADEPHTGTCSNDRRGLCNLATPPSAATPEPIIEYKPGEWFDATTVELMEGFYRSRLPAIREAAKEHGYAIGVHGSMRRDLDLIAAPWRDGASDADTLVEAVQKAACGFTQSKYQWEKKPAGRIAISVPICWTHRHGVLSDGHIDLSVLGVVSGVRQCPTCDGDGWTEEGDPEIGSAKGDCPTCKGAGCLASPTAPSTGASEPVGDGTLCGHCDGSGTVLAVTGHLGPDDYEYEAQCEACWGTGSSDLRDAINALSYQPHSVTPGRQMVHRADVLRIIAARTTPPPAPVLSDAEIDAITVAQWGDRVVTAAYRAYARAIEQAIGRASRGAK